MENYLLKKKGYTLLETVLCIFLIGFLTGLFLFSLSDTAKKYNLQKAVWEVHSRLNQCRYRAIFEGKKVRIRFRGNAYSLEEYAGLKEKWVRFSCSSLEGVSVKANNSPIFHPSGTVSNLASFILKNKKGGYKITLAISGRVRIVPIQEYP